MNIGCASVIKINTSLFCSSLDLHYIYSKNEYRLRLGIKNKHEFILFFSRLALYLHLHNNLKINYYDK